jgi:hypothetical protein
MDALKFSQNLRSKVGNDSETGKGQEDPGEI